MDFSSFVNPADLTFDAAAPLPFTAASTKYTSFDFATTHQEEELVHKHQDSAVDLTKLSQFPEQDYGAVRTKRIKKEPVTHDAFVDSYSSESNTPSPAADFDFVYSNANSPGEFTREESRTSSPDIADDMLHFTQAPASSAFGYQTPEAIHIPQSMDAPTVSVSMDRTKTRAETQTKVTMILDPLNDHHKWARFARHTISKPKQFATADEIRENKKNDATIHITPTLVCAVAVESKEGAELAMARARGQGAFPQRPRGLDVAEIDKEDVTHPQNGGAVMICNGCQERERKRFGRKKKRCEEEEEEWRSYDDKRIIIINEKEFKKWSEADLADGRWTQSAKKIEFVMRIACYCRHQESKTPVGYRVIFTITGTNGEFITQCMTDILQVTDDHKNKEAPQPEILSPTLGMQSMPAQNAQYPQYAMYPPYQISTQFNYTAPAPPYGYNHPPTVIGIESQCPTPMFSRPPSPGAHSQPTTPSLKSFNFGYPQSYSHAIAPQQLTQTLNRVVAPQQSAQSLRHPAGYPVGPQSMNQPMGQSMGQPISQPMSQSMAPQQPQAYGYSVVAPQAPQPQQPATFAPQDAEFYDYWPN
jgi:hypothetical protein